MHCVSLSLRWEDNLLLEQLCLELERKAVLVREQRAEFERMQAAHSQMSAALEVAIAERRESEQHVAALEAGARRLAKHQQYGPCPAAFVLG